MGKVTSLATKQDIEPTERVNPMQRLGGIITIPEWLFTTRPQTVSKDPAELRYICPVCGLMEPKQLANGYLRRECACEKASRELQSHAELVASTQATIATKKASKTYTWLGETSSLEDKAFGNFDPLAQFDKKVYLDALRFVREYTARLIAGQHVENILMSGGYGTGKTHLAAATLNSLRADGIGCLFCTASGLFDALYAQNFSGKEDILRQAGETPLLVIDDLDKLHVAHREEKADEGAYQKKTLFRMLDSRYRRELPTIITTNEQHDLSTWLDGATISRLAANMKPLTMNGTDYRMKKVSEGKKPIRGN